MKALVAVLVLALASPSFAAEEEPKAEKKKERVICKREVVTGSRMGAKRICRTAEEWKSGGMTDEEMSKLELLDRSYGY